MEVESKGMATAGEESDQPDQLSEVFVHSSQAVIDLAPPTPGVDMPAAVVCPTVRSKGTSAEAQMPRQAACNAPQPAADELMAEADTVAGHQSGTQNVPQAHCTQGWQSDHGCGRPSCSSDFLVVTFHTCLHKQDSTLPEPGSDDSQGTRADLPSSASQQGNDETADMAIELAPAPPQDDACMIAEHPETKQIAAVSQDIPGAVLLEPAVAPEGMDAAAGAPAESPLQSGAHGSGQPLSAEQGSSAHPSPVLADTAAAHSDAHRSVAAATATADSPVPSTESVNEQASAVTWDSATDSGVEADVESGEIVEQALSASDHPAAASAGAEMKAPNTPIPMLYSNAAFLASPGGQVALSPRQARSPLLGPLLSASPQKGQSAWSLEAHQTSSRGSLDDAHSAFINPAFLDARRDDEAMSTPQALLHSPPAAVSMTKLLAPLDSASSPGQPADSAVEPTHSGSEV